MMERSRSALRVRIFRRRMTATKVRSTPYLTMVKTTAMSRRWSRRHHGWEFFPHDYPVDGT